jgi:nucleotide-binding universal stress UspA family protein
VLKILVALDFDAVSRGACRFAGQYAAGLAAAEIHFLHVLVGPALQPEEREFELLETTIARMREVAEAETRDADDRPLAGGVALRYRVERGAPDEQILRVARDEDVDGIVLATHGRKGIERLLLGSVAEKVVRGAPCSVIVVKQKPS